MTSQIVHELAKSGVHAQDFTAGQWSAIVNAAYACFTAGPRATRESSKLWKTIRRFDCGTL